MPMGFREFDWRPAGGCDARYESIFTRHFRMTFEPDSGEDAFVFSAGVSLFIFGIDNFGAVVQSVLFQIGREH
jgi:hypothetical protein